MRRPIKRLMGLVDVEVSDPRDLARPTRVM